MPQFVVDGGTTVPEPSTAILALAAAAFLACGMWRGRWLLLSSNGSADIADDVQKHSVKPNSLSMTTC